MPLERTGKVQSERPVSHPSLSGLLFLSFLDHMTQKSLAGPLPFAADSSPVIIVEILITSIK